MNGTNHTQEDNFSTAMGILHITTILLTTAGNMIVITVIIRTHKLHTITSSFLLNLAASDMAAGLFLLPFAASSSLNDRQWLYSHTSCTLVGFLYILLCCVSTWTLACISLERFIAINNPLKYHRKINRQRVLFLIVSIWVGATANAAIPFIHVGREAYEFLPQYPFCLVNYYEQIIAAIITPVVAIFIPFVIMCYTYLSIGRVACSHATRKVVQCNEDHCMFVAPKRKDYRAAKILAVMAGVFLICWIPFTILSLWQACTKVNFPFYLTSISLWLTFLSSTLNPLLYSLLNRTFRLAMRSQCYGLLQALHIVNRTGVAAFGGTTSGKSHTRGRTRERMSSGKKSVILQEIEGGARRTDIAAKKGCRTHLPDIVDNTVPGIVRQHIGSSV